MVERGKGKEIYGRVPLSFTPPLYVQLLHLYMYNKCWSTIWERESELNRLCMCLSTFLFPTSGFGKAGGETVRRNIMKKEVVVTKTTSKIGVNEQLVIVPNKRGRGRLLPRPGYGDSVYHPTIRVTGGTVYWYRSLMFRGRTEVIPQDYNITFLDSPDPRCYFFPMYCLLSIRK